MTTSLTEQQRSWVDETLKNMTMEQKIGHLLCPESRNYSIRDWMDILDKIPLGAIFLGGVLPEETELMLRELQRRSDIPLLVAADMERGAVGFKRGVTHFPDQMALGAADDVELAYQMGRATARESRSRGVHWTFSPVVDLNLNFQNPVTNHRALGDDPDKTIPLLKAIIKGLQEDGLMAATAKHFPGDGVDDRDQHLCTSVNYLPYEQWDRLYGRVWSEAFEAGVMSVMAGHISLPAYQGFTDNVEDALPATLCGKLQIKLLRDELGFDGVLVSDAAPMIGITSRVTKEEMVVQNIKNGSDCFLFAHPEKDFQRLMDAVKQGTLDETRVEESVKRVLEMKARLNLHENPFDKPVEQSESEAFLRSAQKVADKSVTMLKKPSSPLPQGKKALSVTIIYDDQKRVEELDAFDKELKKRGYEVDHLRNPSHNKMMKSCSDYDVVFVNIVVTMHMQAGTVRMTKEAIMPFWRGFFANYDNVRFTSFGNPYTLYELPHLPNLMLTYSAAEVSQIAAVKAWLGEIPAEGVCPVKQPKVAIREWPGSETYLTSP